MSSADTESQEGTTMMPELSSMETPATESQEYASVIPESVFMATTTMGPLSRASSTGTSGVKESIAILGVNLFFAIIGFGVFMILIEYSIRHQNGLGAFVGFVLAIICLKYGIIDNSIKIKKKV